MRDGVRFKRLLLLLLEMVNLARPTVKKRAKAGFAGWAGAPIELEGQAYGRLRSSDDFRGGVEAFQEKRKPAFRGR